MTQDPQFFTIAEFATESRTVLPEARIAYRTFGPPGAPRGAVLVPPHFTAGSADSGEHLTAVVAVSISAIQAS